MSHHVGVVLAGGAGRRMGGPKGELRIGEMTLAERAASVLWPSCGSVVISVAPGAENPAPKYPAVHDALPAGRGPLAGILAAYEASGNADLLVLACDYAWVTPELIQCLISWSPAEYDLVMPTDTRGWDHPLVAQWSRRALPQLREAVEESRYKVRSLLAECNVKRLDPAELPGHPERLLRNANTPQDLI